MIVYILGEAHSGKGEAARHLVAEHGFTEICFADPMKRVLVDWYGFTEDQLWGESGLRNVPDSRFPRTRKRMVDRFRSDEQETYIDCLTPREALQTLGEAMRGCFEQTWNNQLFRDIQKMSVPAYANTCIYPGYVRTIGVAGLISCKGVRKFLVSDVRHRSEHDELRAAGAVGLRIVSPTQGKGLTGKLAEHRSETEQREIPDSELREVVHNDGTIAELHACLDAFMEKHTTGP